MNEELVATLQELLDAALQGKLDNLLYFAQVGDKLLVGQSGDIDLDKLFDISVTVDELIEYTTQFDDSNNAKRLVRL